MYSLSCVLSGSYSEVVITPDFESGIPGSNPGTSFFVLFFLFCMAYKMNIYTDGRYGSFL